MRTIALLVSMMLLGTLYGAVDMAAQGQQQEFLNAYIERTYDGIAWERTGVVPLEHIGVIMEGRDSVGNRVLVRIVFPRCPGSGGKRD